MCEFDLMKSSLTQAKYGSFLVVPLKYEADLLNLSWLEENGINAPIRTADITESIKESLHPKNGMNILSRYVIAKEKVSQALFGTHRASVLYTCEDNHRSTRAEHAFSIENANIYVFHTQVAFLCLTVRYETIELLNTICNLGYTENHLAYFYVDEQGKDVPFDLPQKLVELCAHAGLEPFFPSSSLFLEAYTYTTALVPERFQELETIRQITFNLHHMVDFSAAVIDAAEEDVNYVYSVKDLKYNSYGWGCCVTSQTISYVVADERMDMEEELHNQAENGLPLVLFALYQKYTCLRFKSLVSISDQMKIKRLNALKSMLLEFQAYGIISPANISRWHNVRQIYHHLLDEVGVPDAIADISTTLNLLTEQQAEFTNKKENAIMGLLSAFSIVTIPLSLLDFYHIFTAKNDIDSAITLVSLALVVILILILALHRKKK